MSKHGQPMSQTLAQMHLNELKMNDPKLNKIFDKLKPKATVQLKTSSTIAKGDDFKTYLVVSKNTLRNGVEKITLKNRANPTGVKSFLYRRDGKVTFAIGDMGASIDDIKEKYSIINHEIIEDIEVEELDEMKEPFVVVDTADGDKVVGTASSEKGAKEIITTAQLPPMKIKDKKTLKIVKVKKKQMIGYPIKEEVELDEAKFQVNYSKGGKLFSKTINAKNEDDAEDKAIKKFKIEDDDIRSVVKEEVELDEGTWAVPETPAQKRDLKKLLSKPLPLGKEGENASDKMYSIIGDDELFDDLYSAGKESPDSDARPIIKKAMKRLKIKENSWDSWRLDESTKPDHIKVFNSLKRGDKVEINYDSAIAGGTTKTFVIKTKNKVYKGKVDKVTMYPDGKTGGVKFHLYQYDNRPGVYMAIGDMGASLRDIKKI